MVVEGGNMYWNLPNHRIGALHNRRRSEEEEGGRKKRGEGLEKS